MFFFDKSLAKDLTMLLNAVLEGYLTDRVRMTVTAG